MSKNEEHLLEQSLPSRRQTVCARIAYGAEMSRERSGRGDSVHSAAAFKALIEAHPEEQAWLAEWYAADLESPVLRWP